MKSTNSISGAGAVRPARGDRRHAAATCSCCNAYCNGRRPRTAANVLMERSQSSYAPARHVTNPNLSPAGSNRILSVTPPRWRCDAAFRQMTLRLASDLADAAQRSAARRIHSCPALSACTTVTRKLAQAAWMQLAFYAPLEIARSSGPVRGSGAGAGF